MTDKEEIKEFNTLLAELLKTYEDKAPPMMPCYTKKEQRKMAVALSATMAACIRDSKMSAKKKKKHYDSMQSTTHSLVSILKKFKP